SAEAVVTEVGFADAQSASAFRTAVLGGADVAAAAAENGGEVTEHGRVLPGELENDIDTAVFRTEAFEAIPGSAAAVSDVLVLETGTAETTDEVEGEAEQAEPVVVERYVVVVAERTPERVRPLADVRSQIENSRTSIWSRSEASHSSWARWRFWARTAFSICDLTSASGRTRSGVRSATTTT